MHIVIKTYFTCDIAYYFFIKIIVGLLPIPCSTLPPFFLCVHTTKQAKGNHKWNENIWSHKTRCYDLKLCHENNNELFYTWSKFIISMPDLDSFFFSINTWFSLSCNKESLILISITITLYCHSDINKLYWKEKKKKWHNNSIYKISMHEEIHNL